MDQSLFARRFLLSRLAAGRRLEEGADGKAYLYGKYLYSRIGVKPETLEALLEAGVIIRGRDGAGGVYYTLSALGQAEVAHQ